MRIETIPFERTKTYSEDEDFIKVKTRQPERHASWCSCPHCIKGQMRVIREDGIVIYSNCINCSCGVY